jgi:hypothetical protein
MPQDKEVLRIEDLLTMDDGKPYVPKVDLFCLLEVGMTLTEMSDFSAFDPDMPDCPDMPKHLLN